MNEKQQNQIIVQNTVMVVVEKYRSKWQTVGEFKNKVDSFVWNLKKIEDYNVVLQIDLAPIKERRNRSKRELIDEVFPITSVLGVYAHDMGDSKLKKVVNRKFSALEKLNYNMLASYCIKVLKSSGKLLDQSTDKSKKLPKHLIMDYGLTVKHLDSLQAAIDDYISANKEFSETRLSKRKSKIKLKRHIRENNMLLKKSIDRMMHMFRDTQRPFYNAYIKARIPVDVDETAYKKPATTPKKPPVVKKPQTNKGSGTEQT